MNYIPGFSNYLETTAPRYARGGPARFVEEDIYGGGYDGSPLMYSDPMAGAAPITDTYQQAAVMPMTQEAAPAVSPAVSPATTSAVTPYDPSALAGLDLSGLNSLYGMNFGTDFGGGAMGGQYQADPNVQYIGAPLSNKGNATSQTGGNVFAVRVDQPVRLVDHRTNQVVFEGTGFDAARKATELGQGLTDEFGRKANYSIQTADPAGNYSTVAYEKKNKSTLGTIANVAGTLLPLAMIPLTAGASAGSLLASTAGKIGLGTALGAAGAGLKGDNILKGAVMGGLSSAGGALLGGPIGDIGASNIGLRAGTAIGTGIGSTAGGLVTGQNLKNSLLGGVASGALSYITPDIAKALSGSAPASTSTSTGGTDSGAVYGGPNAEIIASGIRSIATPNINLGGFKSPTQKYLDDAASDNVSDPRTGNPYNTGYDDSLINVTGSVPGAVTGGLNLAGLTGNPAVDRLVQTETTEPGDEDIIKVTGQRPGAVTGGVNLAGLTATPPAVLSNDIVVDATKRVTPVSSGLSPDVQAGIAEFEKNPIISEGSKRVTPVSVTDPGLAKRLADMENYAEKPLIEVTGNKTERPTPVAVSVVPPLDPLPPMDLKADPALTDKDKLGVEDYLRLASLATGLVGNLTGGGKDGSGSSGTYIPGGAGSGRLNPIFSAQLPAAGGLGSIGATRTARALGDVDWLTYGTRPELKFFDYSATPANPAPVTSPVPGNPAGPIMQQRDPMAMAEGGALAAKRGGQSRRTEFAVNGPGTGRSDDIPAVLSDGEYVIDAETVALLGDGSSKAGAKKLDELRVKVRKHKGQKLAKGRFSANAKKPEAYLSGGRI
jgi:hypothetical protein